MRVLVAEDDAISRAIVKQALIKAGHECFEARDGLEAWQLFQTSRVDVIISDWMMPHIDGVELCRKVREHSATASTYTYFIFLTALGERHDLLAAMAAGGDDYLTKPLDRVDLQVQLKIAERVTSLYHQVAAQNTELERLNGELFRQARRDPLTQLGNRLHLREDLLALQAQVERYGSSYCLVICDVDHFKAYNDRYGHLAGDDVLRTVAGHISASCRQSDHAYRYGGEEFLLVLPEQSLESSSIVAERLRRAIEADAIPNVLSGDGVVTISAGIACFCEDQFTTFESVLRRADDGLYLAKRQGRNRLGVQQTATPAAT